MYRIVIDRSLCSGYGICEDLAPHVFEVADDGIATARLAGSEDAAVVDVAAQCPMAAISVSRDDEHAAAA